MYQNGKRVNGYPKKRLHKRKQKEKYAKKYIYGDSEVSWDTLKSIYKDTPKIGRYHPLNYWRDFSLSGPRAYAKQQTNSVLRSRFKAEKKEILMAYDVDDLEYLPRLTNSNYRKYYEYKWTVW